MQVYGGAVMTSPDQAHELVHVSPLASLAIGVIDIGALFASAAVVTGSSRRGARSWRLKLNLGWF